MKYTWEPDDVKGGRVVRNSGTTALNNKAMICYVPSGPLSLVSLADGMVIATCPDAAALAKWLNDHKFAPIDDDPTSVGAINYLRGRTPTGDLR